MVFAATTSMSSGGSNTSGVDIALLTRLSGSVKFNKLEWNNNPVRCGPSAGNNEQIRNRTGKW